MTLSQPGILAPVPHHCRYLEFGLSPGADAAAVLKNLQSWDIDETTVIGFGPALVQTLGQSIEPLRSFPAMTGPGCEVPSTQSDLWCWLRGDDRGVLLHKSRTFRNIVAPAFRCDRIIDGFMYDESRDLSGYIDGTENPDGDAAVDAAIAQGLGPALDGSSFVAVQQWVHDLDHFLAKTESERDNTIGRRIADNEEFDEAPESAHVKRSAQESFDPEAFMVRRSMPWTDGAREGLVFVAFGKSFDAFEAVLRRMTGQDDNIVDGLFSFTHPVTGSYFWCPPVKDGALNLSALGL